MGVIDRIRDAATVIGRADAQREALSRFARIEPLSPWAKPGGLYHVDYPLDMVNGAGAGPVTQSEAMRVPAVKKGRALLLAVLKAAPLVAIRNTAGVDAQLTGDNAPTWLYRSDTGISPELRMEAMFDDHLFREATVLALRRGAPPADALRGPILDAVHVPYEWWDIDEDGTFVWIRDGKRYPADPDEFLWIPGPSRGLLEEARGEIRQWLSITRNTDTRLASPTPGIILQDSEGSDPDDDEVRDMVAAVAKARRSPDGAVMYVPASMTATPVDSNVDASLYVEARNALRIDLANHMNLPVAMLDGSPATASLTYSTGEGKRSEFDDLSLPYWTSPLTAGLSGDDVVPRGTRIRFDFSARYAPTNAPTGASTPD